jgi:hypothetical protein
LTITEWGLALIFGLDVPACAVAIGMSVAANAKSMHDLSFVEFIISPPLSWTTSEF